MRGLEQMGGLEPRRGTEMPLPIESPEVQAALMLREYRDTHHRGDVDPADWEHNSEDVRNAAMIEWLGSNEASHAALFRAYAEDHPHMQVDIKDDAKLAEILASLESGTLH